MRSFTTACVHAGREDLASIRVHAPPLDLSSTYPLTSMAEGSESLARMADGGQPLGSSVYARLHNPTVGRVERAIAELEGADGAVAFSSGMAAVSACLLSARRRGGHVVALRPLYGGTDVLLTSGFLDVEVTWATAANVGEALRRNTSLVLLETPANPTLELIDINAVVRDAGEVPVLVDSTFMTPALQKPLAHGAAYSLHSATKALGGHGDVVGGVVACSEELARDLRKCRVLTGGILNPHAAFLLHRGLQTLSLRVEAAQRGAVFLADRLATHPAVQRVYFPGLHGADPLGLIGRQMGGPGSILSFQLRGGLEAVEIMTKALNLITPAVSLGCNDTLIQHPAGLTHHVVDEETRDELAISEGLLRLSTGIEDPDELWADLESALGQILSV